MTEGHGMRSSRAGHTPHDTRPRARHAAAPLARPAGSPGAGSPGPRAAAAAVRVPSAADREHADREHTGRGTPRGRRPAPATPRDTPRRQHHLHHPHHPHHPPSPRDTPRTAAAAPAPATPASADRRPPDEPPSGVGQGTR